MIKNEREYRITRAQAKKFADTLAFLKRHGQNPKLTLEQRKLERMAVVSQLEDLQTELEEYDRLKAGTRRILRAESLEELAMTLIQARIARQLTQRQLADRLGLKEQQVQRYEATDYRAANLERLGEVARALGVHVSVEVPLPKDEKHARARRD